MISVIVPIYNAEEYLSRCLDSICNQSFKDLEIILIDDGSTDSSLSICNDYMKKDSRIKVFSQKNSGVSSTRNVGIKQANGEYITFVDSDDFIENDMYECLLRNIKSNDYDVSSCLMNEILINEKEKLRQGNGEKIILNNNDDIMKCYFGNFIMDVSLNNKLFKRKVINNIFLNERISINEDKLFIYYILKKSKKIIHENTYKYYYYKHNGSASTQKYSDKYNDIITVSNIIKNDAIKSYPQLYNNIMAFELISYMNYYRILLKRTNKNEYNNKKKKIRNIIISLYKNLNIKISFKRKIEIVCIKISQNFYLLFLKIYDAIKINK